MRSFDATLVSVGRTGRVAVFEVVCLHPFSHFYLFSSLIKARMFPPSCPLLFHLLIVLSVVFEAKISWYFLSAVSNNTPCVLALTPNTSRLLTSVGTSSTTQCSFQGFMRPALASHEANVTCATRLSFPLSRTFPEGR